VDVYCQFEKLSRSLVSRGEQRGGVPGSLGWTRTVPEKGRTNEVAATFHPTRWEQNPAGSDTQGDVEWKGFFDGGLPCFFEAVLRGKACILYALRPCRSLAYFEGIIAFGAQ